MGRESRTLRDSTLWVLTFCTSTVGLAPAPTLAPLDATVCAGDLATFSAAAGGSPAPAIQWQSSATPGAPFLDIPGETRGTLTFTASAADSGKAYRAVFANDCTTEPSGAATLVVRVAPEVHPATRSR